MYMLVFTVNITLRLNSSVNEFVQYNFFKKNNIYKFSDRKSGFDAVVSWFKEKSSYNLMEDSCSGVCGHYTQVEHHSYLDVERLQISDHTVCLSHLYISSVGGVGWLGIFGLCCCLLSEVLQRKRGVQLCL